MINATIDIKSKLKDVFGYDSFRGKQEAIIDNLLSGNNTLVIMPTGAGKSLCYQLPAVLLEGTAIVISPLIALMKNQVDQMNALGINAKVLNSTLSKSEINKVKKDVVNGEVKLLYVAPESLSKEENINFFKDVNVSFIAVDEAHCISEWGHDFRPEYRRIKEIIARIGDLRVIALTATATPKVQLDIIRNLQMEDANIFKTSFNRKNLYYEIRPKKDSRKQLIKFVKDHKGKSGIIYCWSRKKVEEIAEFINVNGIKARAYHAGMESGVREKNQDDFLNEEVDVIVATIAFGMGIDKPDIRFVVHYDAPKSLESYYQETGRAGRDGLEGHCLMFYSYKDVLKLEKFNKDKTVSEKENAKVLLEEVIHFAEASVCRRKMILHYFGEHYPNDCNYCDNCKNPRETFICEKEVVEILNTIYATDQRFGIGHIANVLKGSQNQYVMSYGHDSLPQYKMLENYDLDTIKSIIRQSLVYGLIEKDIETIGIIKVSAAGDEYLLNPHPITFSKDRDYSEIDNETSSPTFETRGHDTVLFDLLKEERKSLAKRKELPPYVIFQDPQLEEMATTFPTSYDELVLINGIGQSKAMKFGKSFLALIKKYIDDNDIETPEGVLVKTSGTQSKVKRFIIEQTDKKVGLEEIADAIHMTMDDLLLEIEKICQGGTRLNLDYYIDDMLDEELQEEIFEYFMNSETDSIEVALEELGDGDFSEEEIRLMRVKFLSEVAH